MEVEAEADFFLRRPDLAQAIGRQADGQDEADPAFAAGEFGCKIPAEECEERQAEEEGEEEY